MSAKAERVQKHTLTKCPRCEGSMEEPGAPIDLELGVTLCTLCRGMGRVRTCVAERYEKENALGA